MKPPIRSLWNLYLNLADLERGLILLNQAKRRERGAYVSRHLSEATLTFEKLLLSSYHRLFEDIVASLKGRSDDISTARFHQATHSPEIEEAADYFDLDPDELDEPLDRSRLAAVLALLALWKQRHKSLLQEAAQGAFDIGRGRSSLKGSAGATISPSFVKRYEGDVERLGSELENGTKRSEGIRSIVEGAATLGAAALALRRLEDKERFRVEMLSEHLMHWSDSEGFLSGAKDDLTSRLALLGYDSIASLPDDLKKGLPRYAFVGPDDNLTCGPCAETLSSEPVFADALVSPEEICLYSQNCRHSWEPVSE